MGQPAEYPVSTRFRRSDPLASRENAHRRRSGSPARGVASTDRLPVRRLAVRRRRHYLSSTRCLRRRSQLPRRQSNHVSQAGELSEGIIVSVIYQLLTVELRLGRRLNPFPDLAFLENDLLFFDARLGSFLDLEFLLNAFFGGGLAAAPTAFLAVSE